MSQVISITQLNQQIKGLLESNPSFRNVFVQGEISNYKLHTSGHHYFTLKDDEAAINAVLFRAEGNRLRFRPENGIRVIARGRIGIFPKTGLVQLYLADMMPDGAGGLHLAFEQLKSRLMQEGLFDCAHKKSLPKIPQTIALVTSPTGAAVQDMLRILSRRFPLTQIQLWPVLVQGERAAQQIASAIQEVNQRKQADVIIVGRGGGSFEDLWAFNEEVVARAIYQSEIPVVSAVGHEPDVTISDFVADLRAPTPSGAAELVVPDQKELQMMLSRTQSRLTLAIQKQLELYHAQMCTLEAKLKQHQPHHIVSEKQKNLLELQQRMKQTVLQEIEKKKNGLQQKERQLLQAQDKWLTMRKAQVSNYAGQLQVLSPLQVLERGYAVVTNPLGTLITRNQQVQIGQTIQIQFARGSVRACVETIEKAGE